MYLTHVSSRILLSGFVAIAVVAGSVSRVSTQGVPVTTKLAEGWTALAAGDLTLAARSAEQAMADAPRSASALTLAVEVDLARSGAHSALDSYERWLGGRKVEAAYVLRRIAQGHLRAVVAAHTPPAYVEALSALAADGDQAALAELARGADSPNSQETKALAALGDRRAIETLIRQLRLPVPNKLGIINALADGGVRSSTQVLVDALADPHEELRAGAAEALGRLGATETISRLKLLLQDPLPPVRLAAAGALYRLQDYSGLSLLQPLVRSEVPSVRLSAAQIMAGTPTPEWQAEVRALTTQQDELVQLGAARLLAPHDPQAAAAVFERLGQSGNMAMREEAARASIQTVSGDFTTLRRFLRNADQLTAVRAAARILESTR